MFITDAVMHGMPPHIANWSLVIEISTRPWIQGVYPKR